MIMDYFFQLQQFVLKPDKNIITSNYKTYLDNYLTFQPDGIWTQKFNYSLLNNSNIGFIAKFNDSINSYDYKSIMPFYWFINNALTYTSDDKNIIREIDNLNLQSYFAWFYHTNNNELTIFNYGNFIIQSINSNGFKIPFGYSKFELNESTSILVTDDGNIKIDDVIEKISLEQQLIIDAPALFIRSHYKKNKATINENNIDNIYCNVGCISSLEYFNIKLSKEQNSLKLIQNFISLHSNNPMLAVDFFIKEIKGKKDILINDLKTLKDTSSYLINLNKITELNLDALYNIYIDKQPPPKEDDKETLNAKKYIADYNVQFALFKGITNQLNTWLRDDIDLIKAKHIIKVLAENESQLSKMHDTLSQIRRSDMTTNRFQEFEKIESQIYNKMSFDQVASKLKMVNKFKNKIDGNTLSKPLPLKILILSVCVIVFIALTYFNKNRIITYFSNIQSSQIDNNYDKANELFSKGNYTEAIKYYEKAANKNHNEAMCALGIINYYGFGVNISYKRAKSWFVKSIDNGNTIANHYLGRIYYFGLIDKKDTILAKQYFYKFKDNYIKYHKPEGVIYKSNFAFLYYYGLAGYNKDFNKAKELYEDAAVLGDTYSNFSLGNMYYEGIGIKKDYAKAKKYYDEAIKKDFVIAYTQLGLLYENGFGVDKNYYTALQWYKKGAKKDDPRAIRNLGVFYGKGYGVNQDYSKAKEYFKKAIELGNSKALISLGVLYHEGKGVKQDYKIAKKYYESAAEYGESNAFINLGILYINGEGVTRDYKKAIEFFEKAANLGNADAYIRLGNFYYEGKGGTINYQESFKYFLRAAEFGISDAMYQVGYMLEHGEGIGKNVDEARKWYQKGKLTNEQNNK